MSFAKVFLACGFAVAAFTGQAFAHGENVGGCVPAQVRLGGEGGAPFTAMSVDTLRLRHGSFVDAIIIDGNQSGGNGGQPTGVLTLQPGEYINRVVVRHGAYVDRLEFYTSHGRALSGGGTGGSETVLNNIRVLTLGGRSGAYLDQIQITFCANYLH